MFLPANPQDVKGIRAISPGVVYNAGLLDLAAVYANETGVKVPVTLSGMGRIVNDIKTVNPPPDVIFLPFELMTTRALDGGVKGTFTPVIRKNSIRPKSWPIVMTAFPLLVCKN